MWSLDFDEAVPPATIGCEPLPKAAASGQNHSMCHHLRKQGGAAIIRFQSENREEKFADTCTE